MAMFFKKEKVSAYTDRRFPGSASEYQAALLASSTVYIGNLSFYTTEEQIQELCAKTGEVKRIVMGLDRRQMTPCGFCFIIYYTRSDAEGAVKYISNTMLDDRPIRIDFDWGFLEGRQWGRGRSGGQVRDEFRTDYDPGRGGYGKLVQRQLQVYSMNEFGYQQMEAAAQLGHGGEVHLYTSSFKHNQKRRRDHNPSLSYQDEGPTRDRRGGRDSSYKRSRHGAQGGEREADRRQQLETIKEEERKDGGGEKRQEGEEKTEKSKNPRFREKAEEEEDR